MTNTTYYNLNIVEGSDIVNPLTVDNPNYEKIDETMHNNAVSCVTLATEIANATVHAITRENSECAVIRFISTSVWKAGDTMTVDGVPVTALLPSGETLPDGAYVINANVLCILTGTNLTVYAERKKTDNASDIRYNDTNVADAITNINSNFSELGTGTFYGWSILRVQGGVGYLYITDTNIKYTDTITFNENIEIVGVVYKQLSSIIVTNRNGGFLVTITFDGMDNYNNSLVGFEYTVRR